MGEIVATFHAPRGFGRGRNLQATGCVLGGKYRVEILSLNTQLLRLGQLLTKPRRVVPIRRKSMVFSLRKKRLNLGVNMKWIK